jgi:hypothetical protein
MPPHPKDRRPRITPEQIAEEQQRVEAHATEVLEHMYQAMLKIPEFTLGDGTKCKVDPYYGPETNADGEVKCGIDVLIADGSHLEFTVTNTGWGKSLAAAHAPNKPKPGRER